MVTEDRLISVQTKETISTLINKFFEILSEPMCSLRRDERAEHIGWEKELK